MYRMFQSVKFRPVRQPTSWSSKISACKSKQREKVVVHARDFLIFRYFQLVVKAVGTK